MCTSHLQRQLDKHLPRPRRPPPGADAIMKSLFRISPSKLGQFFNLGQCNRLLHQSTERRHYDAADIEDLPSDFRQATIERGETFEQSLCDRLARRGLSRKWMEEKLGGGPAAAHTVDGRLHFTSSDAERAEALRRDATATFGTFRDLKAEAVANAGGLSDAREVEKQLELLSKQALQQDVREPTMLFQLLLHPPGGGRRRRCRHSSSRRGRGGGATGCGRCGRLGRERDEHTQTAAQSVHMPPLRQTDGRPHVHRLPGVRCNEAGGLLREPEAQRSAAALALAARLRAAGLQGRG